LVRHHGIRHLTATSYDSELQLIEKYPQARGNVGFLREERVVVMHGVDVGSVHKVKAIRRRKGETVPKITKDVHQGSVEDGEEEEQEEKVLTEEVEKIGQGRTCGFDIIGFMFPHVGGKSTDMDRQIRANQRLPPPALGLNHAPQC
jgi:25S rRNA (uracil2634-N3)-methyltransferase